MNRDINADFAQSDQVEMRDLTFLNYATVCKEYAWLIGGCGVVLAGIAFIWSFLQTPIYQTRATVVIDREGNDLIERERTFSDVSPEYFQTQFELMKSRIVLQRTAEVLHLSEYKEYSDEGSKDMAVLSAEDKLIRQLQRNVDIIPIRGARLAHIFTLSQDPKLGAEIANTLAEEYINRAQELNAQSKEKSAQWLMGHLENMRSKVEASQQALYAYRLKHGLLGSRDQQAMAVQTNMGLDAELIKAEMQKAEAKAHLEQIQSGLRHRADVSGAVEIDWSSLDASPEVLRSPLIQTLRTQEITASGQVAELADKYGPLHPKLARAKTELQDHRERIRQEVEKIFNSLKRDYDGSVARVRAIREAAGRHRQEKLKLEQADIEYGVLEREAESTQHMYDIFLRQAKMADISAGVYSANVYLADPAVPSAKPYKPKRSLNTFIGLLLGLMTGVGYVVGFKTRDQKLKDPTDLARCLPHTSVLGVVPVMPKAQMADRQLLVTSRGETAVAESVRIIRTNMLFTATGDLPSCVLITSPGEGEGKTTLAVSLSAAQAQLEDVRVLLINGDLRTHSCHEVFTPMKHGSTVKGLNDFLNGEASIEEIIYPTTLSRLSMIPGGSYLGNAAELLQSKRMRTLLQHYRDEGFHIIVDAPPILPVADALILGSMVDGVLLVVEASQTTSEACRLAVERVSAARGRIIGVVMQKTTIQSTYALYGRYPAA